MKNRIASGFDFLAPFYDVLARLIIGRDIVNAQLHFLDSFKPCNHILILGGGSGWILKSLFKVCPGVQVDYVELSPKMIEKARKNSAQYPHINFITGTEDQIPYHLYDGVITNFYLDMFDESNVSRIIGKIKQKLTRSSLWMVTDFVEGKGSYKIMLWTMYRFFRLVAHIEATHLPDWQKAMIQSGLIAAADKKFKNGFISSNLYQFNKPS